MMCISSNRTTEWEIGKANLPITEKGLIVQMGKWRLPKVTLLVGGEELAFTMWCSRLVGSIWQAQSEFWLCHLSLHKLHFLSLYFFSYSPEGKIITWQSCQH